MLTSGGWPSTRQPAARLTSRHPGGVGNYYFLIGSCRICVECCHYDIYQESLSGSLNTSVTALSQKAVFKRLLVKCPSSISKTGIMPSTVNFLLTHPLIHLFIRSFILFQTFNEYLLHSRHLGCRDKKEGLPFSSQLTRKEKFLIRTRGVSPQEGEDGSSGTLKPPSSLLPRVGSVLCFLQNGGS